MGSPESQFLEEMNYIERYSNQWIAISGTKVIANGKSLKDVYADAINSGVRETPLFEKIPDKDKEQTLFL